MQLGLEPAAMAAQLDHAHRERSKLLDVLSLEPARDAAAHQVVELIAGADQQPVAVGEREPLVTCDAKACRCHNRGLPGLALALSSRARLRALVANQRVDDD